MKIEILVIDDEQAILRSMKLSLMAADLGKVDTCHDSREALSMVEKKTYDIILLDITMPHISGEELLEMIHHQYPEITIIIVSGNNDVELAIRCIQKGALDYLLKPVEASRLITTVKNAASLTKLNQEQLNLKATFFEHDLKYPSDFEHIITQNEEMFKIMKYIEAVSKSDHPILILGETGVGKDLIAEAIHRSSKVSGEFIVANVNEYDQSMFIDSLYGHSKGSFTGATEKRKGLIEAAEDGTLFLDEIGDLETTHQVKLLRLIQNREYRPIGSDQIKRTNAKIIVATNISLKKAVQEGRFRKDLYFRLHAHEIQIPALRQRRDDIPLLSKYFIEKYCAEYQKEAPQLENKSLKLLASQNFEGNVRELKQFLLNLVLTFTDDNEFYEHLQNSIESKVLDLVDHDYQEIDQVSFPEIMPSLKELSALAIKEALKRSNGKQSLAAKMLGITASALNQRLKK